jgi:hypothetical protein
MERIMECMEHQQAAASSASSAQLQAFIGQGEFFSLISYLKNYSFTLYSFPWSLKSKYSLLYIVERSWAAAGFPTACPEWSQAQCPR